MSSYRLNVDRVQTGSETLDPLDEISNLVTDGKISAAEADRIKAVIGAGGMTAEETRAYVRQKR
ncbi:MAG TPA: hypothetical protein VG815_07455 [Chloroflexota bacterium]|jgi:hypothetical protein|nr:hypothetical protein [Chloroflexota bacterium]